MVEAARALLDQLMGKDRDLPQHARLAYRSRIHFTAPSVCKSFIAGFCERQLFAGTRIDLGSCPYDHDDTVRAIFQRENLDVRFFYEENLYKRLRELADEADRKVEKVNESNAAILAQQQHQVDLSQALSDDTQYSECLALALTYQSQHEALTKQQASIPDESKEIIKKLLTELAGKREENELQLQSRKSEIEENFRHSRPSTVSDNGSTSGIGLNPNAGKKMLVCDVCGLALVAGDDEARMAAHSQGRQHLAYEQVRDWIAQYEERKRRSDVSNAERAKRAMDELQAKQVQQPQQPQSQGAAQGTDYRTQRIQQHDDRGRGGRHDDRGHSQLHRRSDSRERDRQGDRAHYRSRSRSPRRVRDRDRYYERERDRDRERDRRR